MTLKEHALKLENRGFICCLKRVEIVSYLKVINLLLVGTAEVQPP
jgi:hypothetical protein